MARLLEQFPPAERNAFLNELRRNGGEIPAFITAPATNLLEKAE
jgi:hypothetical protein